MSKKSKGGALNSEEKRIVKSLLRNGWRNQDIQALVNRGRRDTINSARITEVKQNQRQQYANESQTEFYIKKKKAFDLKTGLNLFDDERLIRAREAMILAVQIFNSAGLNFKTEVFSVLANIAWTYLLHEFYEQKGEAVIQRDGRSLLLSQMIEKDDCPITDGMRNNLRAIKTIRDDVEHQLLGKGDLQWQGLFQACCLNFNKVLTENFGEDLSLANELSLALQFAKMDVSQLSTLNPYEIPEQVRTIDARLNETLTEQQLRDLEYQFSVIFTMTSTSKSQAHLQFVHPDSAEGTEIQNVLVKYKTSDSLYPLKPTDVCKQVRKKSKKRFTTHNHTQAWKHFKIRPVGGSKQPDNTNKEFCVYHTAHGDYTYSERWVDKLCKVVADADEFSKLQSQKV